MVNGYTIPYVGNGRYVDSVNVLYRGGETYHLQVEIDSLNYLDAIIKAPYIDSVLITTLRSGDTLPYDSVAFGWRVFGIPSGTATISLHGTIIEIDPDTTSYRIDSTIVLEVVRNLGPDLWIVVAYYNELEFPELSGYSSYSVGASMFVKVYIDTTR